METYDVRPDQRILLKATKHRQNSERMMTKGNLAEEQVRENRVAAERAALTTPTTACSENISRKKMCTKHNG